MADKFNDYCENYGKGCKDCIWDECWNKHIADAIYNPQYYNRIISTTSAIGNKGKRTYSQAVEEKAGINRLMHNKDIVELFRNEAETASFSKLETVKNFIDKSREFFAEKVAELQNPEEQEQFIVEIQWFLANLNEFVVRWQNEQ